MFGIVERFGRRLLFIVTAWTILVGGTLAARPNVVLFLIDDLSHYGVTAYGADRISEQIGLFENQQFRTPSIDRLAREGLRCDYAYAYPNNTIVSDSIEINVEKRFALGQ